jgi:hypothetical protein
VKFADWSWAHANQVILWFLYIIVIVIVVVTSIMANVPTLENQKLFSDLIKSLRFEYENIIQQYPDADAVIECTCGILNCHCPPNGVYHCVSRLNSVVDSNCPKHGGHEEKGKQLTSGVYGVYTEVLHNFKAVLEASIAKGVTAKTTI